MIKENVHGSKYVDVPTNNISSWCTSSRGTIFAWGADIEQFKVSDTKQELEEQQFPKRKDRIWNQRRLEYKKEEEEVARFYFLERELI
jgi:hypothetical protein